MFIQVHAVSALSEAGSGTFPTFVSVTLIDLLGTVTLVLVVLGIFWKYLQLRRYQPNDFFRSAGKILHFRRLVRAFFSELLNRVFLQKDVINRDPVRRFTHLAMYWGFVGLGITSVLEYIFNRQGNYVPLYGSSLSAIRILGNIAGVVMMIGATIAVVRLVAIPKYRLNRKFSDVWFTALLFVSGASGFITEYFGEIAYAANPNALPTDPYSLSLSATILISIPYGFHLATIALLFLTAPFSFFMHVLQVPSMRYIDRIGMLISGKINRREKNQLQLSKESAMLDQVQDLYEKQPPEK